MGRLGPFLKDVRHLRRQFLLVDLARSESRPHRLRLVRPAVVPHDEDAAGALGGPGLQLHLTPHDHACCIHPGFYLHGHDHHRLLVDQVRPLVRRGDLLALHHERQHLLPHLQLPAISGGEARLGLVHCLQHAHGREVVALHVVASALHITAGPLCSASATYHQLGRYDARAICSCPTAICIAGSDM